jgi:hypothetical protein
MCHVPADAIGLRQAVYWRALEVDGDSACRYWRRGGRGRLSVSPTSPNDALVAGVVNDHQAACTHLCLSATVHGMCTESTSGVG